MGFIPGKLQTFAGLSKAMQQLQTICADDCRLWLTQGSSIVEEDCISDLGVGAIGHHEACS